MNKVIGSISLTLGTAGVIFLLAFFLGFHNWWDTTEPPKHIPQLIVEGVFPVDVIIQFNYTNSALRKDDRPRAKRDRYSEDLTRSVKVSKNKSPQTVQLTLEGIESIGGMRVVFGPDTTKPQIADGEGDDAQKMRLRLQSIKLVARDSVLSWTPEDIVSDWKGRLGTRLKETKSKHINVVSKAELAIIELKAPVNLEIADPVVEKKGSIWLNLLPALFFGMLAWWLLGKAKKEGGSVTAIILPAIFTLGLVLPHLDGSFSLNQNYDNTENRTAAVFPSINWHSIYRFPDSFDAFYDDHFGLRSWLIRLYSVIKYKWFGVSPFPDKVMLGEDGWLYKAEITADYTGRATYSEEELRSIANKFQEISDKCDGRGVKYYLFISPDKFEIYPENLVNSVEQYRGIRRLDQVQDYLRKHTTVRIIDARQGLFAAKPNEQVFHKTDIHWNDMGAFIAAQAVSDALSADFESIHPETLEGFRIRDGVKFNGGLSKMANLSMQLTETTKTIVPNSGYVAHAKKSDRRSDGYTMVSDNSNGLKALVFHDSFFNPMMPFFSRQFSASIFIKNKARKSQLIEDKLLARVRPDVMIHQIAQFSSMDLLQY